MGRRSHSRTLGLWANGERVGRWTVPARGEMELQYDETWVRSSLGRPLSLSLPFNPHNEPIRGDGVAHYFDNLLPDSDSIRRRVAARFKTGSIEAFDLLRAIGRDCVGALQLLDESALPSNPDQVDAVRVDEAAIEQHLLNVVTPDKFGSATQPDDDFRISLAGAQEKDAIFGGTAHSLKPRGSTPTTHIFKLPLGLMGGRRADFSTSVDNEWLCLRLLRAYGLPSAKVNIVSFGSERVLVVERFDRRLAGGRILRLPQEDFCQATGTSPLMKYENEGGPGLRKLFALLQQSQNAQADIRTDGFASPVLAATRPRRTCKELQHPLAARRCLSIDAIVVRRDVSVSDYRQWRISGRRDVRMAMALLGKNRHYHMATIQRRHFNSTARQVGLAPLQEAIIQDLIAKTPGAIT